MEGYIMELTNDDNLIYSHFKGKRVAIFGHLDYLSNKDIERIVQNSKGYYFKSAFENTLDCIILDCKTYAVYNKVFFKPNQDIALLYDNISKNNICVVSEIDILSVCNIAYTKRYLRYKGEHIFYPLSNYVVLDIICTGFDSHLDEILHISAIKVKHNVFLNRSQENIFEISLKCMPFTNNYLIKVVRGDTPNSIIRYTLEEAIIRYINFIEDLPILTDKAILKNSFIFDLYYKSTLHFMTNDYIDILQLASNIFPKIKKMSLQTLGRKLNIDLDHHQDNNFDWCNNIHLCYQMLNRKSRFKDTSKFNFNAFNNKGFVLEGVFESISRSFIVDMLEKCGAKIYKNVIKSVDYLLLSNSSYLDYVNGKKSKKQVLAENLIMEGNELLIISEGTFRKLLYYNCTEFDSSLVSNDVEIDKYNLLSNSEL